MLNENFSPLTTTAIQAAIKAGHILKKGFGTTYEITSKPGRQNFVTEYDKASEACIISFIKERFPSHSILAEESGFLSQAEEDMIWIIDPLDGTNNFAHHIPIFTISIAAYQQEKGLCGVIFQPLTQELFVAEVGKGAYLNGSPLTVSKINCLKDSLMVAGLSYYTDPTFTLDINQINAQGTTFRNFGSAALSLAYVASGKIDALWAYNLYSWDLAAGRLLIEEAGGVLTYYANSSSIINTLPVNILATNQALHPILQSYLSSP